MMIRVAALILLTISMVRVMFRRPSRHKPAAPSYWVAWFTNIAKIPTLDAGA